MHAPKFRFSVVYVERNDELYVLAVAPFSRKPGYWRSRRSDAQGQVPYQTLIASVLHK